MSEETLDRNALKKASVSGAAISIVSQVFKFGLLFSNQVIMARLLTPADFGLVAMITPIMAFVVLFSDMGINQTTISRPKITQDELTFLFWVNVAVATFLAVVFIGISPLISAFYNDPRVTAIAMVMGSSFILSGLYSQQMALFTRNMQFKKIAFMDIGSLSLAMLVGIIAALNGFDYWSLVIVHMTLYCINLFNGWMFSSWRPGRPVLPENWKSLLGMGGNLSSFNFFNYFARNLDNVLIGRFNGEVALGLYDRAYKLLLMPIAQISQPFARIIFPVLSRTINEPELYKKAFMKVLQVIMLLTYPGVLYVVIDSDNFLVTILGEKWREVGPIFGVLGLGAFIASISNSTGWLFISQDRTKEMRNWGIGGSILVAGSFVAGLPWGPIGVATAYVISTALHGPFLWWAATRSGPVSFRDLLKMLLPFFVALILDSIGIFLLTHYIVPHGIWGIMLMIPLSYVMFFASMLLLPQGRETLFDIYKHAHAFLIAPLLIKFKPSPVKIEDEPL